MAKNTPEQGGGELAPLMKYEVLCEQVKVGEVIAYRTAQVNLTQAQAEALESVQPGSLKFLGI